MGLWSVWLASSLALQEPTSPSGPTPSGVASPTSVLTPAVSSASVPPAFPAKPRSIAADKPKPKLKLKLPRHRGNGLFLGGALLAAASIGGQWAIFRAFGGSCHPPKDSSEPTGDQTEFDFSGFGCAHGPAIRIVLHGVAALGMAGGVGMTSAGAVLRGRYDAAKDKAELLRRDARSLRVGGAITMGLSLVMFGANAIAGLTLSFCEESSDDAWTRQAIQAGVTDISVVGIAIGAGLLGYGRAYDRAYDGRLSPVVLVPQLGRHAVGLSLRGRF